MPAWSHVIFCASLHVSGTTAAPGAGAAGRLRLYNDRQQQTLNQWRDKIEEGRNYSNSIQKRLVLVQSKLSGDGRLQGAATCVAHRNCTQNGGRCTQECNSRGLAERGAIHSTQKGATERPLRPWLMGEHWRHRPAADTQASTPA